MIEKSGRPAYLQLADQLRTMIRTGQIPDGQPLPSTSQLVIRYGVSTGVVKSAISVLRTEGFAVGQQGKAVFARATGEQHPGHDTEDDEVVTQQLAEILKTLRDLSNRMARLEAEVFPTPPRTQQHDS